MWAEMTTETLTINAVREREGAAGPPAWAAWNLTAITLLVVLLLFQVQPMIGKFILPWFGGCPAVWTTCMLFFQACSSADTRLPTGWRVGRRRDGSRRSTLR